jgi:diketogulonate reductase-like aldo/keto reductase
MLSAPSLRASMAYLLPQITLRSGAKMPFLGMGTWHMGERRRDRAQEVTALRLGIDLGMTLIDTAEMYAEGGAEEVVGEAITGRRKEVFLVSKVYPHHASRRGAIDACKQSLRRLATDQLDLYLLHWRGSIPLAETVAAFEALRADGLIRAWGVSNFDRADMEELLGLPGGEHCVANQVLYNLDCRGIEWDLLPLCREQGIAIMAYSPLDEGRLVGHSRLKPLAAGAGTTAARLALAWLLAQKVVVIAKAADAAHVEDNRSALDAPLGPELRAQIEHAFPPPTGAGPLRMI